MKQPTAAELFQKVKAATGPDAALNAQISCRFFFPDLRPARPDDFDGRFGYSPGNIKTEHGFLLARNVTGSIADALLLAERVFPDCIIDLEHRVGRFRGFGGARIIGENGAQVTAATTTLAIVAAVLLAVMRREVANA